MIWEWEAKKLVMEYDFQKIADMAIYRPIMKSGPDSQSRSWLLKLIVEEAIEIITENHRERKLEGIIQDVRDGVKQMQLLRV
jgi:hypothetical protein